VLFTKKVAAGSVSTFYISAFDGQQTHILQAYVDPSCMGS
jgi:hypothetical protein